MYFPPVSSIYAELQNIFSKKTMKAATVFSCDADNSDLNMEVKASSSAVFCILIVCLFKSGL